MDQPTVTDRGETPPVSTGRLPEDATVDRLVHAVHEEHRSVGEGEIPAGIPAIEEADPDLFGIAVVGTAGRVFCVGDAEHAFSIQSVSKPFTFALVCQALGHEEARERLGVNNTGQPFDSVMAVELNDHRTMNPMVNAGAIATTSHLPGSTAEDKWQHLHEGLSAFAGRDLEVDEAVYEAEVRSNQRNRGIAHLLEAYDHLGFEPDAAVDLYTRQCALLVTAVDLAVMGATLANGGVNPRTGDRVIDPAHCQHVLAVLATSGLYERSGDWLYEVGLPGKSGVSGGIVTASPGKAGLATYSPPLDPAGNSVRGRLATTELAESLGLNLFASRPFSDD
ncbi:glutaminase A [Actinotalea sp. BY-33]|uniref:Glutaminase n=1 Tax=Actinotalea soli TaxID=2819234 RepID=A0A939LMQ1_9CELL|nr:glutaminase A [Actinotalea soli]MBO1750516.1 glutaminase A [Actinotalea soli]